MAGAANHEKSDSLNMFIFSFFLERATITVLMLFWLSELSLLPGFSSVFDPFLGYAVDIPLATTFIQMVYAKIENKSQRLFRWERLGFFMAIPYHQFRYKSCLFMAVSIFIVTTGIMINRNIDRMVINPATSPDHRPKTVKEVSVKSDRELPGTIKIKKNESRELDRGARKEESKTIRVSQEAENELKKMKGFCLNLEEEKKKVVLKLDIANEAVEYYQGVVKDFAELSLSWDEEKKVLSKKLRAACREALVASIEGGSSSRTIRVKEGSSSRTIRVDEEEDLKGLCLNLEEEKKKLMLKVDIANETLEYYQDVVKDFTEQSLLWDEEKRVLASKKLDAASQNHQELMNWPQHGDEYTFDDPYEPYYIRELIEQKQELAARLEAVSRASEFHKACLNDYEDICRNMRMEITEVSAKHFAETLSAERYKKLSKELEEKYGRLEEEKSDISAKLHAAKASSELYRSLLQDSFLQDYGAVHRA